ncbi:MAG: cryptochrome/photolyase family protein [Bacteroidetes bacterium]|nr:cryptochrome/photolyase family protein [Bacteroidota bacterium]
MSTALLIFPHQLYKTPPAVDASTDIFLVEEWLYFRQYLFHQQKIILHRASMKYYEQYMQSMKLRVRYIESHQPEADVRKLIQQIANEGYSQCLFADPSDDWLLRRLLRSAEASGIECKVLPNPNFITPLEEAYAYFDSKKRYFQTDFYIHQRKQLNILLEEGNKPVGGQWTFDADNREKLPKNITIPSLRLPPDNEYTTEARQYVKRYFSVNYGNHDTCYFPVTHAEAESWLEDFLEKRFALFGKYEDAMHPKEHFLFHSAITPMLNIGLLDPKEILNRVLTIGDQQNIPLNSLEGFIRQLIGWREFMHIVYRREGSKQRTTNYWKFSRKIPSSFWKGTTGIEPVDIVIKKILETGYCHHIERLMILGNFMLLCEFDPDEVYQWFMEMFADAYDWVMVPNVYGMTQFADGGLITTKPYISSSNYLLKMGDWKKGKWCEVWDGLFWHFMDKQRTFFGQNPRLGMLLKTFDKMSAEKQQQHLTNAIRFLNQLDAV